MIALTLTRIMFQSENAMIVDDALQRIDSVLHLAPLPEPARPKAPVDGSLALERVHFAYDGGTRGDSGPLLTIPAGRTVALVGPSGGGKSTLAYLMARYFGPQKEWCASVG